MAGVVAKDLDMSCGTGANATAPSPAIAPGVEALDAARVAREVAARGPDARITRWVAGFDAPFFQAGLAGYSDAAMRIVARRHGAPLCVTEALLDRMLLGGGRGFDKADLVLQDERLVAENLPCSNEDFPLAGQIIGADPAEMAASALKMLEQGRRHDREYREMAYGTGKQPVHPDTRWRWAEGAAVAGGAVATAAGAGAAGAGAAGAGAGAAGAGDRTFSCIDVNLACPVKKIDRKHRGGHWLTDAEGAIVILKAVRDAVPSDVACTVKLRRAYDDTPEMARQFERVFDASRDLGYAWATVHARTVEQRYVGPSRWDLLKSIVARHRDFPVFGSGDIWTAADIFLMIGYCGVVGASVARGAIGNPWIFKQARQMMAGEAPSAPTLAEQREVLRQHFDLSVAINGEQNAGKLMRKFGIKFAQHHPRPAEVKARMIGVNRTVDWLAVLDELYLEQPGEGN